MRQFIDSLRQPAYRERLAEKARRILMLAGTIVLALLVLTLMLRQLA